MQRPQRRLRAFILLLALVALCGCSSPFTLSAYLDAAPEAGGQSDPDTDPAPAGNIVVQDDFESVSVGTIANGAGYMSMSNPPNTTAEVDYVLGDNVMALSDLSASESTYARTMILPFVTTQVHVEYEVAQVAGGLRSYLEVWDSNFDVIVALYLDSGAGLYYTDPIGTDHLMATVPSDVFRQVRLEIDVPAQSFDLFFDGSLLQADLAFSNPGIDVGMIEFRTGVTDTGGSFLFDDVLVLTFD